MKENKTRMVIVITVSLFVIGCQEEQKRQPADERLMDKALITTYNDVAIQNALIAEHTIYPYHFVQNATELNALGRRDLAVLIRHFAQYGGSLTIQRQDTSEDLYQARVDMVRQALQKEGIDMARITLSDSMPGGPGMPSEKVLDILGQGSTRLGAQTTMGMK